MKINQLPTSKLTAIRLSSKHYLIVKMAVFWVVASCSLLEVYRSFGDASACVNLFGSMKGETFLISSKTVGFCSVGVV
jgi:hypothetical protein